MKLSMALATYNGERFLAEQLKSFADQTLPPDELIVCDDQSSDRTMELVREFQGRVGFQVVATRNEHRLGVTQNFAKAIEQCTGDIIFISDQDDVWAVDKLRRHRDIYVEHENVGMVFNNASLVDDNLKSLDATSFQKLGIDEHRLREFARDYGFEVLIRRGRCLWSHRLIPLCVVAVRPADTGVRFLRHLVGLDCIPCQPYPADQRDLELLSATRGHSIRG